MSNVAPSSSNGEFPGDYLQVILNNMLDMICLVSIDGIFLYVSPSHKSILGYHSDELIGRSIFELLHPEDFNRVLGAFKAALINKTPGKAEYRYRHKDGHYIWLESVGNPLFDDNGAVRRAIISSRDITESKRAELALLESEERLRLTLDAVNDGVWDWDLSTGNAVFSPRWYTMLGYEPYEFPQNYSSWRSLVHPDDLERSEQEVNEHIASGEGYAIEIRMLTKSGDWLWVLARGMVVERDDKGRPIRMVGTHSDITESKRAEEALRSERDNADRYLNVAEVILVVLDTQARITLLNRKGYQVLGYDEGELIGKNWIETCLRLQDHQSVHEVNRKINAGELEAFEYYENYVITKKGDERIIAWHTTIIRDDDGHITGTISSGEDITERKLTEEALEESEAKYRRLFENSPVGIISVSLDGQITEVNKALVEVMGSPSAEATKQLNVFEFPPMVEAGIAACVNRCIESGEPVSYEHPYRSKWGKSLYLRLKLNPIHDAKGIITGVQSTVEDISKQKLAEEKLITSLHEKEVLLKEIHHRVKNNLQVVSSLLGVQAHYAEDERLSGVLGECRNRVKSMALIHENLYKSEDLARVDFARYTTDLTKSLISSFGADRRRIKLNLKLDQVLLSINKAIPSGLIVNELISNCLKHAFPEQRSGEVQVELRSLDNGRISLVIRDNGIGLPETLEPQKAKTLGLRLVMDLVKQIKGDVQINHSGGTEFKIVFPAEP